MPIQDGIDCANARQISLLEYANNATAASGVDIGICRKSYILKVVAMFSDTRVYTATWSFLGTGKAMPKAAVHNCPRHL